MWVNYNYKRNEIEVNFKPVFYSQRGRKQKPLSKRKHGRNLKFWWEFTWAGQDSSVRDWSSVRVSGRFGASVLSLLSSSLSPSLWLLPSLAERARSLLQVGQQGRTGGAAGWPLLKWVRSSSQLLLHHCSGSLFAWLLVWAVFLQTICLKHVPI